MQRMQAEIMWFLWRQIFYLIGWLQGTYCQLANKDIWDSPFWDWYLVHIAAEAYYHESKLEYVKDGLWPPPKVWEE